MKKTLLLLGCVLLFKVSHAQTTPTAKEKVILDSICNCMSKVDLSKVKTKADAENVISNCMSANTALLIDVAEERKVNIEDQEAMRKIGVEIGKELVRERCAPFMQIIAVMTKKQVGDEVSQLQATGTFKRIDDKGFNYFVISDINNNTEKSFLWLRQFPGSEKFIANSSQYIGKRIKISYQELEVYLPQAKGYYKVKEITSINIL